MSENGDDAKRPGAVPPGIGQGGGGQGGGGQTGAQGGGGQAGPGQAAATTAAAAASTVATAASTVATSATTVTPQAGQRSGGGQQAPGPAPSVAQPSIGATSGPALGGGGGGSAQGGSSGGAGAAAKPVSITPDEAAKVADAINAIGASALSDQTFDPVRDAEEFEAAGGALAPLAAALRRDDVLEAADRYFDADQAALQHQERFRFLGYAAASLTATAVACGALHVLLTSGWIPLQGGTAARVGDLLLLLQFLALIGATASAFTIRHNRIMDSWLTNRAMAETARFAVFRNLFAFQSAGPADSLALLKLEYFRRYFIEAQRNYAMKRVCAIEYDISNRRNLVSVRLVLIAVSTVAALFFISAVVWGGAAGEAYGALSTAFNLLAAAVAGWLFSMIVLRDNKVDAARYRRLARQLQGALGSKLNAARLAALRGRPQTVKEYVDAISEITTAEHEQWLAFKGEGPDIAITQTAAA